MLSPVNAPEYVVCLHGNARLSGRVVGISADGDLSLAHRSIAKSEWFFVQQADIPRPEFPSGARLILINDDVFAGNFVRGNDKTVTYRTDMGDLAVTWSALDLAWLQESPSAPADWLAAPRRQDRVLLANGEVIRGDISGFTNEKQLTLTVDGKSRLIPESVLCGIAINPALTVLKSPNATRYRIVTSSGSRITATNLVADGSEVAAKLIFGAKVRFSWNQVVAITKWSDDVTSLSDLKPSQVEEVPYGDLKWHFSKNRSVKGNPLRLRTDRGIETFEIGLGTHPRTKLVYELNAKYSMFEALVGFDAATGRGGLAKIAVHSDSKVVQDFAIAAGDEPRFLQIDVKKAKRLTLITDFGPGGDVQADVNWVDARLLK